MTETLKYETTAPPSPALPAEKIECYLLVSNPTAKNNLGNLIRCAAAFGVAEVVVVGFDRWSTHGAHGSHKHVNYRCFDDWISAAAFLRLEKRCDLCGIIAPSDCRGETVRSAREDAASLVALVKGKMAPTMLDDASSSGDAIDHRARAAPAESYPENGGGDEVQGQRTKHDAEGSKALSCNWSRDRRKCFTSTAVRRRPFRRSTAFVIGHRNRLEMEEEALEACDFFVHVQQAAESRMELGVPVTTSIALHHFTSWARYNERQHTGEKFDVETNLPRYRPPEQGKASQEKQAVARNRARLKEERLAADPLRTGGTEKGGKEVSDSDCEKAGLGWLSLKTGDEGQSAGGEY